jgi:hypothetical protein
MLAELATDFAARRIGRSEWLAARDVIDERVSDNRRKLTRRAANPFDQIADVRAAWPSLSLDQRRSIVSAIVDRVEVGPATRRGPVFDTGRIAVRFRV